MSSWTGPWAKYKMRVGALAASSAPLSLNALNYVIRAVPTLSFVAQFFALPDGIRKFDIHVLVRLLRFPGGALRLVDFFALKDWGGPKLRNMVAMSEAALIRFWVIHAS
eukprot:3644330-Pyramimonas_sp.AAC.1